MAGHKTTVDIFAENRRLDDLAPKLMRGGFLLGAICLAIGAAIAWMSKKLDEGFVWHAFMTNVVFFLTIALGGLFFVTVHHVTRAGWGTVMRRIGEGVAAVMPLLAVLMLVVLWKADVVYNDWWNVTDNHHIALKQADWLQHSWFIGRVLVYFACWIFMARYFFKNSVRQDQTGDPQISAKMRKASAPLIIVFAVTISFGAFDILMSLIPGWFSTIFGIYFFAGCALSFFSTLALILVYLQSKGRLTNAINQEHYHDVGKLMIVFIVFWAYVAYSQFMLIWYANLPEETIFFQPFAWDPQWKTLGLFLIFGHFFLPFLAILSRHIKRNKKLLAIGAVWILFIHWMDLFLFIMPQMGYQSELTDATVPFINDGTQIGVLMLFFLGIGGLFVAAIAYNFRNCSLVAEKDPRLGESLAFENY